MRPVIAIPVRNDAHALCACLGSLLPYRDSFHLSIVDSSDVPLLDTSPVSRLVGRFECTYQHMWPGHLVRQRHHAIQMFPPSTVVLMADADLVFLDNPVPALQAYEISPTVVFGQKVDAYNDRRYPDYVYWSAQASNHSFHGSIIRGIYPEALGTPDSGLMYGTVFTFLKMYERFHTSMVPMGILDDGIAQLLTDEAGTFAVDTRIRAEHLGNNGAWNIPWQTRKDLVKQFLQDVTHGA